MNTCVCPPDARSVHADCVEEENRYKWIESEKAGYDIGFERALLLWLEKKRAAWREKLDRDPKQDAG